MPVPRKCIFVKRSCVADKKDIYLRLWADYEARGRAWMMYRQHLDQISSTGSGVADNRPQYLADFFRVRRFFDTFIGFHTVRPRFLSLHSATHLCLG